MAWMNLSPLTPVALTTPRFLRWCSGSRWTTGSTTPSAAWWVGARTGWNLGWQAATLFPPLCLCDCAGLVQPRPGVCLGWVLRQERRAGLSQTPVLPAWPPGEGGERGHYRPHPSSLQLCFLRLPCAWEQVWPNPLFLFTWMCRWQLPLNASEWFGLRRMWIFGNRKEQTQASLYYVLSVHNFIFCFHLCIKLCLVCMFLLCL